MSAPQPLAFEFLGVRGSYPVAGAGVAGIGGNTPSVLVDLPDGSRLFLDAGTGIITSGQGATSPRVNLWVSHLHWDHIQGLPFYRPLYDPRAIITVYCHRSPAQVREVLRMQMADPTFPIELAEAGARLEVVAIDGHLDLGGARLTPIPLNHPGGCSGLRIDAGEKSIVYATDHEAGNTRIDDGLADVARGCDALILDAQYDVEERLERRGWGHSSWREAVELARRCKARTLYLFHHDPERDDVALQGLLDRTRKECPGANLAVEGVRVVLG